jgi:hypothetical protein
MVTTVVQNMTKPTAQGESGWMLDAGCGLSGRPFWRRQSWRWWFLPLWTRWMCTGWAPPGLVAPGHLYGRFFAFWVVTLIGGAMTVMLGRSVSDLNGGIVSEPLPE